MIDALKRCGWKPTGPPNQRLKFVTNGNEGKANAPYVTSNLTNSTDEKPTLLTHAV
jgi:hypothetical protein